MGKNRQTKPNNTPSSYHTIAHEDVETHGKSPEFMNNLNQGISDWINYENHPKSPDDHLSDEEMEFIKKHMEDSENNPDVPSGHLTRAEQARHLLPLIEDGSLKVGDKLPSDATFRAYGRTQEATAEYMGDWDGQVIIYRTNNNVKHFNVTKYDNSYYWEKESFVNQKELKIDKITRLHINDYISPEAHNNAISNEFGFDETHFFNATEVIFIDVSPSK